MKGKKTISIVTPIYNEEKNLLELSKRLTEVFENNKDYLFEVILVENGSHDESYSICKEISQKDDRFKMLKLSRNFGCDGAITAGLKFAKGDAAVIMASDLQDPPELINQFIKKWEEGFENIYQIVSKRTGIGFIRKVNSQLFYYIVNLMTGGVMPKNVSDFRLIDKKVYKAINNMQERNRFIRGLFAWSGFKSIGVPYKRPERFAGESKASTLTVLSLALKGIFAYSYIPLQIITWTGILFSVFSFGFLGITSYRAIFYGVPFSGYGTIMGVMLLMFGFIFIFLGIIGKYIGLIYEEVKQRPNFIISESLGIKEDESD
jgi:glycosyltransferase involved in cell wall biosynthesis